MEDALKIALIEKTLEIGVPAFIDAVQGMAGDDVTVDDIKSLKISDDMAPENYFKDPDFIDTEK
jgi:hypothetical protein